MQKIKKILAVFLMLSMALVGCAEIKPVESGTSSTDGTVNAGDTSEDKAERKVYDRLVAFFSASDRIYERCETAVIENAEQYGEVLKFAGEISEKTSFGFLGGKEALEELGKKITDEYFEENYIIIILTGETVGNMKYTVEKTEENGKTVLKAECVYPAKTADIIGAYITPVEIRGRYNGEEISVERTYSREESRAAG